MIGLIFQKELILIKQMHQKSVIFVTIAFFLNKNFKYEPYLCNGYHDLMQNSINFNDIAAVSIEISDCRIHFQHMSKDDAIGIMNNSNLNETSGLL